MGGHTRALRSGDRQVSKDQIVVCPLDGAGALFSSDPVGASSLQRVSVV